MTEHHARISAFLQEKSTRPLHASSAAQERFNKAGVIPFMAGTPRRYLVMKPVAKHAHLPPPAFQLCKGTRMERLGNTWLDIRDLPKGGEPETLAATALREGIEELGLSLPHIRALYDLGPYDFSSATSADKRSMWLFAAELPDESALLPERDMAETTAARAWMTLEAFGQKGRDDHRAILAAIAAQLDKA
jgi:hypothetical protein